MISWAYKGSALSSFDDLLWRYSSRDLASPRRSTVPLLAYWRNADSRLAEFAAAIGLRVSASTRLDFEHEEPVRRGRGLPSCTDIMIFDGPVALALEAKFTEPRYKPVRAWLDAARDGNRHEVLAGWLAGLTRVAQRQIAEDDVLELPYQLVHRAASASLAATGQPWLVYQLFEPTLQEKESYLDDLRGLAAVLGGGGLGMRIVECAVRRSPWYVGLEAAWDAGARDLHEEVVFGLQAGELLEVDLVGASTV